MKTLLTILISILCQNLFGQSSSINTYNIELKRLANEISSKIVSKGKKKIAVWDFTDVSGQVGSLGQYTAEKISIHLTNASNDFQMVDRQHLETLRREGKLKANGSIAPNTDTKEGTIILGQYLGADAIVTGKISLFGTYCDISVKVLDATTAALIVASDGEVQIDDRMRDFLGVPRNPNNPNDIGIDPRGIKGSMGSNETINANKNQTTKCAENNWGDYCFRNNSVYKVKILLYPQKFQKGTPPSWDGTNQEMILSPGLQQCFYNLDAGYYARFDYVLYYFDNTGNINQAIKGGFTVNPCQSKTSTIDNNMFPKQN